MGFVSAGHELQKTSFSPTDIFDRIINVRLNMVNPSAKKLVDVTLDSIIIRSDYEVVWDNFDVTNLLTTGSLPTMKYRIQRSSFKPSIKVQYKRITGSVATQIDVFIDNFYALSKDKKFLMQFNSRNYKVKSMDIMLGYAGQFDAFPPLVMEDYMSFRAPQGVTEIKNCLVLFVTQDKLPPDGTLHIQAVIGNITASPINKAKILPTNYSVLQTLGMERSYSVATGMSIQKLFFDNITKRFSKLPSVNLTQLPSFIPDPRTFLFNDISANYFGVGCILSPEVQKLKIASIKDSNGAPVQNMVLTLDSQNDLISCFNQINTTLFSGMLSPCILNDGSLLIYMQSEVEDFTKREALSKFLEPRFVKDASYLFYGNKLPAVYNIVTGVVAYITCPFYFLPNPFQVVHFANRYTIGSGVAYLIDITSRESVFYVISTTVTFATVEDANEMHMDCITKKES